MADINDLFKTVALPVMPEVGLALISTLDDDKTTITRIHELISQDPTLAAKVLALANSAAFGQVRQVASLDVALRLVGISRIRTLALSACLHNAFSIPEGIDGTDFWRWSMDCAGYADWLASGLDDNLGLDRQRAWLTGLMLRLGELLIAQAHPDLVAQIEQAPSAPGERWDRERTLTGFDEAEVTAELARRWNFPNDIVHGLLMASDPLAETPISPMAGVLHLACRLADQPDADAESIDQLPVPIMGALELKYGWLKTDFPDASKFLNISGSGN